MGRVGTFTHDGLTFDLLDTGPREGKVVLLLHGFPQDQHTWDRVLPLLHGAGLRTVTFDQRGYSPGARPKGRSAYGMDHLVGDALAAMDAVGVEDFHAVGHDWGGAVAWALGQKGTERVRSLTVLSTPHPDALVRSFGTLDQARRSWYMAFFQLPVVPERVVPGTLRRAYAGLEAADVDRYVARFSEPGALTGPLNWYRAMPATQLRASRRRRRARRTGATAPQVRRPGVRVPTTYVWGRHDFALGRSAAEMTQEYVEADYAFVELDAGHWLPDLNAGDVAAAVVERISSIT